LLAHADTPRDGTTGYIRLELPVFHVGYFKNIVAILQCVCKTCARVMVPEDERRQYLRRFRSPHTEVRAAPARLLASRFLHVSDAFVTRGWRAGEHAPRALQEAHGALQTLQDVPLLRRCARRVDAAEKGRVPLPACGALTLRAAMQAS
jgi:DNA-directed RNA polymerase beta' subunit